MRKVRAPIAGRVSGLMINKWRKKRAGKWVTEDRLRAALVGAMWFIPPSIALFGIANTYIDGTPGHVVCLICLFFNGIGVSFRRFRDWAGGRTNQRLVLRVFPGSEKKHHVLPRTDVTLQTQVGIVLTPVASYNADAVHANSAAVISAHSQAPARSARFHTSLIIF